MTRKTLGDLAFLVAAPNLRNSLPVNICNEESFNSFETLLKMHLFKLPYYRKLTRVLIKLFEINTT